MSFKNRKMNDALKTVSQQNGISISKCRHETEMAIEDTGNNSDPKIQTYFIRLSGNRTHATEEFIDKAAKIGIKER